MSSVESTSPDHNLAALLVSSAERHPALPAVAVGSVVYHDYAALAVHVAQLAATLSAASFLAGERIALVARNSPEYIEALFACWQAGLCAVPVNSKLHPAELAYVLEHSGARWAFVDASWHDALADRSGDAPALERVIAFGSSEYARLFEDSRRDEPAAVAAADPA